MTFVQHRMPEKWHSLQNDFKMLTLPKQLQHENIDNFIDFVDGNVLLVDDDICRRRMHMFLSIAERIQSKIKKNWPWANERPTEEQLIRLFDLDEFANVRELAKEDIIPFWKLDEFVKFFCVRVTYILNKRQLDGKYNNWAERMANSYGSRASREFPSVKQEFRFNKNEWIMK